MTEKLRSIRSYCYLTNGRDGIFAKCSRSE